MIGQPLVGGTFLSVNVCVYVGGLVCVCLCVCVCVCVLERQSEMLFDQRKREDRNMFLLCFSSLSLPSLVSVNSDFDPELCFLS